MDGRRRRHIDVIRQKIDGEWVTKSFKPVEMRWIVRGSAWRKYWLIAEQNNSVGSYRV
jgi:hypothetical protein